MNIKLIVEDDDGIILENNESKTWESFEEEMGKIQRKLAANEIVATPMKTPMKTYEINIRSHSEAPDYEDTCQAENEIEAAKIFISRTKGELDEQTVLKNMRGVIEN